MEKRPPIDDQLKPATIDLSGHWDLDVSFLNGKSKHALFIEQKGNWIEGKHKTDFELLDIIGMVEGNELKMRSDFRISFNKK